jgi:hypothetical protein
MYAQINFETNQMQGKVYSDLPKRWTTEAGATIINFNLLTREALYGLGWVPVVYATIRNRELYKYATTPIYDTENKQFVFEAVGVELFTIKRDAKKAVNAAVTKKMGNNDLFVNGFESTSQLIWQDIKNYFEAIGRDSDASVKDYLFLNAYISVMGGNVENLAAQFIAQFEKQALTVTSIFSQRMSGMRNINIAETGEEVIIARDAAIAAIGEIE